jgi:hexosaminidase
MIEINRIKNCFRLRVIVLLLAVSATVFGASTGHDIIPVPRQMKFGNNEFIVGKTLHIYTNLRGKERKTILENLHALPFDWQVEKNKSKSDVQFLLQSADKSVSTVEDYTLDVTSNQVEVKAPAPAGLFYGLQTLQQLIKKSDGDHYSIPETEISDSPRFAYRGFMLDVSRHFFSVDFVKKQIDAMAFYKLNRLHLHLTDGTGWRIEIKKYPRLTSYAAWRPQQIWKDWWKGDRRYMNFDNDSAKGGFYTQNDIRELVRYAQKRHITIIPEIEMPAHSEETMAAYPFLSCPNVDFRNGDMCAGKDSTYRFLENVLSEVIKLFPSEYIHIGGDEAGKAAWKNCPYCKARMAKENLTTLNELQASFVNRIAEFLHSKGRKIIGWDEITDGKIPSDAVVMTWRNEQGALNAIKTGNQAIMSPGEFCYFDAYQDAPPLQPEAIGGFLPIAKVYSYDPLAKIPVEKRNMIQGVQANLWTEYVPTPEHAESMTWPRLLALSEIAWSPVELKSWPDFHRRALLAVDELNAKKYHCFDLKNEVGERPESKIPVKHKALGKKVTYIGEFSDAYPAAGVTSLVDGLLGSWSYNDKRWQGFIGAKSLEVVIDMDSVQTFNSIKMSFLQKWGAGVYIPGQVEFSISADGEHFTSFFNETNNVVPDEVSFKYYQSVWSGNVSGRFIKVKAIPSAKYPGFVFSDEIIVN